MDLAECSAEVETKYPLQVVRYADVEKDGSLKFKTGGASNYTHGQHHARQKHRGGQDSRRLYHLRAGPLDQLAAARTRRRCSKSCTFTTTCPRRLSACSSSTPNPDEPEFIGIVRDGDAVIMPKGFHPNVSVPGHPINFVWMMAAHREVEDRQFGVVTVQPGFDQGGSGLEASRK